MNKILIIEDEESLRSEISEILKLEGYDVTAAGDGKEGFAKAVEKGPDLILCDIMMPEMDGTEVLFHLRENENTRTIPFIFITALAERSDFRKGMELGAEDYLTKPFTRNELLSAIKVRLGKKEQIEKKSEEEMNRLRNNIISHIPHELLTPLNGIYGFGELLRDYTDTLSADEIKTFGNNICMSANRLHSLIKKYLIYVRLESMLAESLNAPPITDLKSLITKLTRVVAIKHNRAEDLVLNLEDSRVFMDNEEFSIIIEELTDNAFKFSKPNCPVNVSCKNKVDATEIIIQDRGRGFQEGAENRIGAFMQFDRNEFEQQGSGLGLVLSQRIVNIYGGSMKIETSNEGTRINIKLPVLVKK